MQKIVQFFGYLWSTLIMFALTDYQHKMWDDNQSQETCIYVVMHADFYGWTQHCVLARRLPLVDRRPLWVGWPASLYAVLLSRRS